MALSRRDFFRRGLAEALHDAARAARATAASAAPSGGTSAAPRPSTAAPRGNPLPPLLLRPPGALPEPSFLTACTRCDDCVAACPMQAIRKAGPEHGPEHAGTPTIVPGEQPCWLCGDLPCIAACATGALAPLAKASDTRMGALRVRVERCISLRGEHCDVCVDRCPIDPKPIDVQPGYAPNVDHRRCTGCGICEWLCPASALEVLARYCPPEPDHGPGPEADGPRE